MVKLQKKLVDYLGIPKLLAVSGGSMGGMQALQWVASYSNRVRSAIVVASTLKHSPQQIAFNEVVRQSIMADPSWHEGDYYGCGQPEKGLSVARMIGHITFMSDKSMEDKFSRRLKSDRFSFGFDPDFEVERYLHYRGLNFVKRFDANSYLCLIKAIDLFDLGDGRPTYQAALAAVKAKMMIVGVSSDILYPVHQQRQLSVELARQGARVVVFRELESVHGHDGFLIDFPLLADVLGPFIESVTIQSRPWYQKRFSATRMAYYGAVEPADREFSSLDRTGAFP